MAEWTMMWKPGAISELTTTLKVVTVAWLSVAANSRPAFRMMFFDTIIQSKYASAKSCVGG